MSSTRNPLHQTAILPDVAGAFCFVVYLAMLLFAGERALFDGDTLWHIRFGELIIERGELITRDLFSHTVAGQPWTSHEWLAEVVMGAVHRIAGLPGVVNLYFLVAAFSFWLLFRMARERNSDWQALFATSLAFILALTHLLARPHIFTWLFGVVTLCILQKGGRKLLLLPLLIIPWANLHGGFALGLVLQGLYLVGSLLDDWTGPSPPNLVESLRRQRLPLAALALSFIAIGVNPFGYHLLLFPFEVSKGSFSTLISEWLSPSLQAFWQFRLYLLFLFFLLFFAGRRISWGNRLALLFFINAALVHARHISIAGIFLTPFLLEALPALTEQLPRRNHRPDREELSLSQTSGPLATALLATAVFILCALPKVPYTRTLQTLIPPPEKATSGVMRHLQGQMPAGNLFNNDEWGDYLIYAMETPPKLFIDGRLDMYGERVVEDYSEIVNVGEQVDDLLAQYRIAWVLFPPSPLTRYLQATGKWAESYRDNQAVILLRRSPLSP